ncbi:MAG: DNA polymerase IV, partial [Gammaproteobacteria bacterium]
PGAELRLLGVGVSGLSEDRQQDLFPEESGAKNRKVDKLLGQVADRFGDAALRRGQHKIP